jgi:histidinol-phosphate aminotransferase
MNLSQLANNRILDQPVYTPGKPIEKVAEQFGLVSNDIIKLASNENPWGASPHAINIAKQALEKVSLYPDGSGAELIDKLCTKFLLNPKQFILGNGSNEIIELLGHVFIGADDEIIFGQHAFAVYKLVTLLMGGKPVAVEMPGLKHDLGLILQAITAKTKIIFLPSPNNPTGTANSEDEIFSFVKNLPEHVILCLDEAYAEYLENPPDLRHFIKEGKKIICLRTFSKIHGLAGLRIGYGYGSNEMISLLQKARQPFNVNSIAQVAAIGALEDESWVTQCRRRNLEGLKQMESGIDKLGLRYIPSKANFILVDVGNGQKTFEELQKVGIITRPMPKDLSNYLRVSIGTERENDKVLSELNNVVSSLHTS